MSSWVKSLLFVVAALFGTVGLLAAVQGDWEAAAGAAFFVAFVGFIAGAGWFHFRFPLPPLPPSQSSSPLSEIKRYRKHYPGWPSNLVAGVILVLFVAFSVSQFLYWRVRL